MIKILDNIIPKKQQEEIKNFMYGTNFPWYFVSDITYLDNQHQSRPGHFHLMMDAGKINSDYISEIKKISDSVNKKIKKKLQMYKVRSFLQLPLAAHYRGDNVDTPHIDNVENHIVILYYVNDSDGCTVIYDKKYEEGKTVKFDELKEIKRVEPKKGRVVIFNGLHYHTGEQPNSNLRSIINCNIQV